MQRIFQFLELTPTGKIDYEKMIAPRADRLLPEVEQAREKICSKVKVDHGTTGLCRKLNGGIGLHGNFTLDQEFVRI